MFHFCAYTFHTWLSESIEVIYLSFISSNPCLSLIMHINLHMLKTSNEFQPRLYNLDLWWIQLNLTFKNTYMKFADILKNTNRVKAKSTSISTTLKVWFYRPIHWFDMLITVALVTWSCSTMIHFPHSLITIQWLQDN